MACGSDPSFWHADLKEKREMGFTDRKPGREVTAVLLAHGADPDARSKDGWTPLTRAATRGDAKWVKLLLDAGADVSAKGPRGWTALHYAAGRGFGGVVQTLVAAGATVNAANDDGATPLSLAKESKVVALLRSHGGRT
jgi:ankyrin repeat protein